MDEGVTFGVQMNSETQHISIRQARGLSAIPIQSAVESRSLSNQREIPAAQKHLAEICLAFDGGDTDRRCGSRDRCHGLTAIF
jgi:hypothetical protein